MAVNVSETIVTSPSATTSLAFELPEAYTITLTVIIFIVTTFGLLGNFMVILIVLCFSDLHTIIGFSLANLALTDLTMLLLDAVPTATDTIGWNLSAKLGCKVPIYLQYVVAEVTSLTLAFLSWDRYRLIIKPIESLNTRSSKQIYIALIAIWIASFVTQIPVAFVSAELELPEIGCNEYDRSKGEYFFFPYTVLTLYIIPLMVIIPCYTKIAIRLTQKGPATSSPGDSNRWAKRKKTIIWIFVLVVLFTTMWLPIHMVHLWLAFDGDVDAQTPLYIELHTAANVLIFINSSVNPYLYAFVVPLFRKHLKDIAACCWCGLLRLRRKITARKEGSKTSSHELSNCGRV